MYKLFIVLCALLLVLKCLQPFGKMAKARREAARKLFKGE
jgi:hypothetical protein